MIFVATWIAKVFFEQIGISEFNRKYTEIRKSHLVNKSKNCDGPIVSMISWTWVDPLERQLIML